MTALVIPGSVLEQARSFFEECGALGHEGTAMIAAREPRLADRLVIPDQIAGERGGWVEVTETGKLQLAAAIRDGSIHVSRIHSHALEAFHSKLDDRNPILTFQGALSIVVPFFGLGLRRGLNACAVFQLIGQTWVEVSPGVERDRVVTQGD